MSNSVWVQTWGQSHAPLSFFHYPVKNMSFRLVCNTAIQGEKLRVSLSNIYGKSDIEIGRVTAAKCDENGVASVTPVTMTFVGRTDFTLKKGLRLLSDPIDMDIKPGEYFCVTAYVASGDLTTGNLLDDARLMLSKGDRTREKSFPDDRRTRDSVVELAGKLLKMHLARPIPVFDSFELLNTTDAKSIVVFGDSVAQQCFWTVPFEKRIRERYPEKYSLINKSVMGNRLLRDCSPIFVAHGLYGCRATDRIQNDIFPYDGIEYVMLALGVNDIFEYASINALPSEKPDPKLLFKALCDITDTLHARGIKVIGFNIPPFGLAPDSTPEKCAMRKEVNDMIYEHLDMFDGFFDIYATAVDPNDPDKGQADFVGGDKLHPNAAGGKLLAEAIDIEMFAE